MSRAGNQDVVTVKPANNVYTVLATVALLLVIAALVMLWKVANRLFGEGGLTA